ncbi:MAG: TonB-dependent receptor [Planctomycetes bacterium]|nr:TonB-dependent receptor [Planctomycetota bacterium]MBL7043529.1 TonB-dependent receptor [Pirellulaceae bacterium]
MRPHYYQTICGLLFAALTLTIAAGEETSLTFNVTDEVDDDAASQENAGPNAENVSHLLQEDTPPPPVGPQVFETGPTSPLAARELSASLFGGVGTSESLLSANRRSVAEGLASGAVLGSESRFLVTSDAGSLLRKSSSVLGVTAQRRSPIMNDPRVRGSSLGQLVASGSYWFPARPDLDTLVSKIDSHIIQDVIVIKGPYSVRHGPGFSFMDFELLGTPRYASGPRIEASTSLDYSGNGAQWYGRQFVWGGGENYGYRVGYGHGTGNDYRTGRGDRIPSSYNSRNFDAAYGFDLGDDSSLEFMYLRQEQTGVELPNNVFDLRYLETDAFEVSYEKRYGSFYDLFTLDGWYNQTRFDGDNLGAGKRAFMPILDTIGWNGTVEAQNMSTGFTSALTWGETDGCHLTVGADLRYLRQNIDEFDETTVFFGPPLNRYTFGDGLPENFPVPDAQSVNPGLFLEMQKHVSSRMTVKGGARLDWVHTDAASTAPLANRTTGVTNFEDFFVVDSLDRQFTMASLFLTAEYLIDENVTATFGGGYAERPPTMFELYSASPLANTMAQIATSLVFGHPRLDTEKRWQVDVGLTAEYDDFRAGVAGYYAWVEDYITLDRFFMNPVADFPLYGFVNTELATLAGGELYAEYDISPSTTLFGNMSYVAGHDHTLDNTSHFGNYYGIAGFSLSRDASLLPDQPLPMIPPLETRVGVRLQEPYEARYGIELSARVVDDQHRVATLLLEQATPSFATLDVRAFWRPSDCLTFVAGVENLADRYYQEHLDPHRHRTPLGVSQSGVFQPGVSVYAGLEGIY